MAVSGEVHITLREVVDNTLDSHDSSAVCAAYTNLGLSHYARKRYDDAIESFEEQILFLTHRHPNGDFNDDEREVLCFAYRLLAQLYAELGQREQALAYSRRCKEVEIDVSLQALVGHGGDGPGTEAQTGTVPSFSALRDQLLNNVEELTPILLHSPKFPAMLNAMVTGGFQTAEQVLQVLLPLLAQPHFKVPKKRQKQILTAVNGLLCLLMEQEGFARTENKLLKMSLVILRFLVRWIPCSFEELALPDIDRYIRQHVPPGSTLFTLWSELLLEIKMKSKGSADGAPNGHVAVSRRDRPPPSPSSSSHSDRDRSSSRRAPSFLADTSTYSSSETDTTTFISMVSDDEDLSWNHLAGQAST
eukprot:GGOE01036983.1.p1 GENE.GGOE01036983.1~~GGOE01036983.1.p1  ORF type:complete len:361 (-),score=91.35 GGOE01036983.1:164-1246(-)